MSWVETEGGMSMDIGKVFDGVIVKPLTARRKSPIRMDEDLWSALAPDPVAVAIKPVGVWVLHGEV